MYEYSRPRLLLCFSSLFRSSKSFSKREGSGMMNSVCRFDFHIKCSPGSDTRMMVRRKKFRVERVW